MPNSFYRFQPAWNAGFYPDNQITANLLNEVAGYLTTWLPSNFSGKTVSQLASAVRGELEVYNSFPYFGDFTLIYQEIFDLPNGEYNISIKSPNLLKTDGTQVLTINGFFINSTKEVIGANVLSFIPGSYSGTFDYSAIPVEAEVNRALQIVEQNGSAFFPLTYSFDSGSNIATSGLARGKNWQLDSSGNATRLPADTLPKQNARTFSVAPQTSEDRYCISLMEKVIQFSFTNTVAIEVRDYFNSFTIPDGWTRGAAIVAGTYERIYLNLYRDDRSLLMIGRLDTTWLWQRFLDDSGTNDVNYFIDYSSTTPLPYLPLASYQWLYNDWYDMEFVEFNSGCYESPEFYAMPAIPGDNWQFNVPSDSGNLTGLTTASVGLFTQDGQFIQQVGEAINPPCCFEMLLAYQTVAGANPNFIAWFDLIEGINTFYSGIQFQFSNQTVNYLGTTASSQITADLTDFILEIPAPLPYDRQDFIDLMASQSWGYGITVTGELINNGPFEGVKIKFCNFEDSPFSSIVAFYNNPGSGENVYQSYINSLCCPKSQFQATTLISAVAAGCYRLGLYAESEGGFYLYSLSNIINIDGSDCFSTMLEFWANDNSIAQGFEYFNGWKQRVRLGINGGGAKPVIEENLYRQSNGVHRRPQNKQDLSLDLHTDFIDPETQLALVDATRHPYLVWDNKSIFVKGDIDVATIQDFTTQSSFETLAQVKFSALLQGFQPKNSSCLTC